MNIPTRDCKKQGGNESGGGGDEAGAGGDVNDWKVGRMSGGGVLTLRMAVAV